MVFFFFKLPIPEKLKPLENENICDLDEDYRAMILTEIIRTSEADVFIFNNFLVGLSDKFYDYFADLLQTLKKDRYVIYFSRSMSASKIGDSTARFTDDTPI